MEYSLEAEAKIGKKSKEKPSGESSFIRLLNLCGSQKPRLVISSLMAVTGSLFGLVPFGLVFLIIQELLKPEFEQTYIWWLAGSSIVAIIGKYIFLVLSTTLSHSAAFRIQYDVRVKLSNKLGRLPLGYFSDRSSGEIKKVLYDDVEQIELFIAHNVPELIAGVTVPLFTLIFMFFIDWRLALAAFILLPFASWAAGKMNAKDQQKEIELYFDNLQKLNNTVVEYVQGMPVIKAFNRTAYSFERYRKAIHASTDYNYIRSLESAPWLSLFLAALGGVMLLVLPLGSWLYLSGNLSLSTLLFFLVVGLGYTAPAFKLMYMTHMLPLVYESEKRINSILNEPEQVDLKVSDNRPENYTVTFDRVSFRYKDARVLEGLSFTAQEGTVTALVGPSGAGKTTAARLIARFWDVETGAISIGGVDVRHISSDTLMDYISFVFQEVFLFNDTIENNLRVGKPGASFPEIEEAARAARCHDFISTLPQGYQTVVGERGIKLSGGEKQRLSIARAILKDAPIVVFDEATAFIDPENEGLIQEAVSRLTRGKSLIVIAHRLSTIQEAGKIVVISAGQAVAQGTHAELLKNSPLYRNLWEAHTAAQQWQLGYQIGE